MTEIQSTVDPAAEAAGIDITRVLEAPRDLVFRAWTEPARFARWFGLVGSHIPPSGVSMDPRPGGQWRATMIVAGDRAEILYSGEYREVVEPERVVFTLRNPSDLEAAATELMSVDLTELGGKTEMRFRQTGNLPAEEYVQATAGWSAFFDRLAEHVAQG